MILAIDGYEANVTNRVGIGRYAFEIVSHLHECIESEVDDIEVRVYLPNTPLSDLPKETKRWRYVVRGPKHFWTFTGLPLALNTDKPKADVIFSPTHYIPRFVSIPRVMSIMDTSYLHFPELFKAKDLYQLIHWTKYSVLHSSGICTISEFSKNAIIKAYGVPENRVTVTYPGFSMPTQLQTLSPDALSQKYGISRHFILSVGTLQPRKNYVRLIEAFGMFLQKNKQKFGEVQLVIVGKKGWLYEKILEAPKNLKLQGKVKFLQFVPDSDLPSLYKNALCFALPSLYEGFGLPVLEAMAYKCPVVVSNSSSLPEIAGKAGIYVKPEDVESIADGLLCAVRQRNLMQGRLRIIKGLNQVKLFTWEKAAKQTLEILTKVAKK